MNELGNWNYKMYSKILGDQIPPAKLYFVNQQAVHSFLARL